MKRKCFKFIKIVLIIGIILISGIFLLFYRSDLSQVSLEEKYFTENSHYLKVSIPTLDNQDMIEIDLHYQDFGDEADEVIVLLHGAFASSHTFIPWKDRLVDENYRVILIDLPYHGLSGGFSDHVTSLRRSSYAVKAILDALHITSLYIGGNSMGGGVSWYFTGLFHDSQFDVKGLILIDSIYPSTSNGRPDGFDILTRPFILNIASKMTPRFLLKNILAGVYGSASILEDETVDRYYDLLRKEGNRQAILSNTQEPLSTNHLESMLEHIHINDIPVLIMWGDEDSWIPVETVSLFESVLINAESIIYEGLGHVPMEENPLLTVEDLIIFLKK